MAGERVACSRHPSSSSKPSSELRLLEAAMLTPQSAPYQSYSPSCWPPAPLLHALYETRPVPSCHSCYTGAQIAHPICGTLSKGLCALEPDCSSVKWGQQYLPHRLVKPWQVTRRHGTEKLYSRGFNPYPKPRSVC